MEQYFGAVVMWRRGSISYSSGTSFAIASSLRIKFIEV